MCPMCPNWFKYGNYSSPNLTSKLLVKIVFQFRHQAHLAYGARMNLDKKSGLTP